MSDALIVRRQDSYSPSPDGQVAALRGNNRAEVVMPDYFMQLVADGRVFIGSNAARETFEPIGDTSYAQGVAGIVLDVPDGTTAIPMEILLRQAGTVANATYTVLFTADTAVRFTSGDEVTPVNYRINATAARSPNCQLFKHDEGTTNLVVANPTVDVSFGHTGQYVPDLNGLEGTHPIFSIRESVAPVLVGPASVVIYIFISVALPQALWHFIWAEMPTPSAT